MSCMVHWCPICGLEIFSNNPSEYCKTCSMPMVKQFDEEGLDEEEAEIEDQKEYDE